MEHSKTFIMLQEKLAEIAKIIEEQNKQQEEISNKIKALYFQAHTEINEGMNLDVWEKQLNESLKVIEHYLKNDSGYDKLRNELFYLKYLIAEKKGL